MWGLFWEWTSLCSLWKFSVRSICASLFFYWYVLIIPSFFLPPFLLSFFLSSSHTDSHESPGWPWTFKSLRTTRILDPPQEGGDLLSTGITDVTPSSSKGVDCLISSCASEVLRWLCPPAALYYSLSLFPFLSHLPFSLMPFHFLVAFANERKRVQTWRNQMDGTDDHHAGLPRPLKKSTF